jgi:hypothetical protein
MPPKGALTGERSRERSEIPVRACARTHLVSISVGLMSIVLALTVPIHWIWTAGAIYALQGPLHWRNGVAIERTRAKAFARA